MAFDPDKYLKESKPAFDPDAYLAAEKSPRSEKKADLGRMAQTALESYGNTAALGYLPHLQAAVGGLMPDPGRDVDEKLLKEGFTITTPQEGYIERRDQNIKRQQALRAENPKSAIAGDLAGIVGGTLITGAAGKALGVGTKATGFFGRMKDAGKAGATIGALANPGDVEGEVSPLQPTERIENAGKGLAMGLATQAGAEVVGKAGKGLADYFKGKAGEKATGAIGATKADMKRLGKKGAQVLGQEAMEQGLVGPLSTPASIASKAAKAKAKVGETIGSLIESADNAGVTKIDGAKIGVELLDDAEILASRGTPGSEGMYSSAVKHAETLASNGELTLKQAHDLRKGIDKAINFNRRRTDLKPGEMEVLYKIRDKLNEAINGAVNSMEGVATDALKKANAQYSKLSRIQEIAENRVAMNAGNRTIGLTDTIAATAGMASGGIPWAAVAAGANKFGRTFGKSLQATGFNFASKGAAKLPALASAVAGKPSAAQFALQDTLDRLNGGAKLQPSEFNQILDNPQLIEHFQKDPNLINAVADPMLRSAIKKRLNVVRKPSGSSDSAFERRLKAR